MQRPWDPVDHRSSSQRTGRREVTGAPWMTIRNISSCTSHLCSLSLTCFLLLSADFFSCVLTCVFVFGCSGSLFLSRLFSVCFLGFPGGAEVKASACNVGDLGSIPGLGRSPGEGNGNPLQYSCLVNPMDGGAWWATVHGVTKSWTRLSNFTYVTYLLMYSNKFCKYLEALLLIIH